MNPKRLLCRRIHRKKMEKSNGHNQFWFVIFASIVFFAFMLYFNSSTLIDNKNMVMSSMNDHAYSGSIMSPESNSMLVIENGDQPISRIPVNQNGLELFDRFDVNEDRDEPVMPTENGSKPDGQGESSGRLIEPVMEKGVENVHQLDAQKEESKPVNKQHHTEKKNGDEPINELSVMYRREEHVNPSTVENNGAEPIKEPMNQSSSRESMLDTVDTLTVENSEAERESDPCTGKYIYVHDLPSRFNDDMIKECRTLSLWNDMCHYLLNAGLGPQIRNSQGVFPSRGWFATDQFTLEIIFNNRMKQYKCLTKNSSLASAIFVPYYAGFDVARYLWGFNASMRDATSLDLVKWLVARPEWKVLGGRDHFLVAGRITWDFRRLTDKDSDWGNNLLSLPEAKNMSMLVIESSPWHSNDFAIPYPTYFHPSTDNEVFQWQNRMRRQKKRYLFSFAGAPRPSIKGSIRNKIIDQCRVSRKKCKLLECNKGANKCNNPTNVMKLFQNSVFCLQPSGDSFTRRSAFDSILAGCIPVFFHPGSAYVQYTWHLPQNYTKYSVLISEDDIRDGKVNIESRLRRISREEVRAMREEVISLIPRLIYADPRSRLETLEDAFDIAVKGVIERVNGVREGRIPAVANDEENYWKYSLFDPVGKHEWDHFFYRPRNANS